MYSIGVYDWSQLATPPELSAANLQNDVGPNDPAQANYDPANPSWTDKTYTFTGGSPTKIKVNDDDAIFEDAYVETGGATTLAEDVTINGTTYFAGAVVENEFSLVDGSGAEVWVLRINGENVGMVPQAPYYTVPPGSTFTPTEGREGLASNSSDGIASAEAYSGVICFAPPTRIATVDGPVPAGQIRPGDMVMTLDHGPRPVRWVSRTLVQFEGLNDPARPILIRRGAFGQNLPDRNMMLSPQHRVLLTGPGLRKGVLAPARGLLPVPRIRIVRGISEISYVHIYLDDHAILSAEGVPAESFYPGRMALRTLSPQDRDALTAVLPKRPFPQARPFVTHSKTVRLVTRHRKGLMQGPEGDGGLAVRRFKGAVQEVV